MKSFFVFIGEICLLLPLMFEDSVLGVSFFCWTVFLLDCSKKFGLREILPTNRTFFFSQVQQQMVELVRAPTYKKKKKRDHEKGSPVAAPPTDRRIVKLPGKLSDAAPTIVKKKASKSHASGTTNGLDSFHKPHTTKTKDKHDR